jgi:hypothetical protein
MPILHKQEATCAAAGTVTCITAAPLKRYLALLHSYSGDSGRTAMTIVRIIRIIRIITATIIITTAVSTAHDGCR